MKIRKILPLLALAVVALFALASCNQVLEAIYPDQTNPPKPVQANILVVYVSTDHYSPYTVSTDIYYGPLTILLMKDGVSYDKKTIWLNGYSSYDIIDTSSTFTNLPDGNYEAYVWIDFNQDGQPTGDYDFGAYWPVSAGYLTGNLTTSVQEYVSYYGYNAKYIAQ